MERYPSYISGTLIQQKIIHTGFIKGHAVVNTHNARCSIYADFIKGYAGLIKGHAVFIKGHAVFIKGHAASIHIIQGVLFLIYKVNDCYA